ncbi:MAG TPA: hypothetical protein VIX20_16750 [Ktedonobacteraceae bacterium]
MEVYIEQVSWAMSVARVMFRLVRLGSIMRVAAYLVATFIAQMGDGAP